jgi:hypothetical protein
MAYETVWIPQDVGTTATPGGGPAPAGFELARGGAPGAGLSELGVAVAEGLAAGRRGGFDPQTGAWAPVQIDRAPTRATAAAVALRSAGLWLPQRTVDLEAHRRRDSGRVSGALSSRPCVENLTASPVELSGAGTTAHSAQRARHCAVETPHVAGDKKKPRFHRI